MYGSKFVLHISVCAVFSIGAFAQNSPPAAVVKAFYAFDRSHSQVLNRRNIDARKQWFSASLYKLFLNELKREREYLKENPPDKPHFGDGLPFTPIDEPCQARGKSYRYLYRVSRTTVKKKKAEVWVEFYYPKQCEQHLVEFMLKLVNTKGQWPINDVVYEDTSHLTDDLQRRDY
ncbi:MAG: hypothetical protein ABIP78_05675 [Pyrinomonadaceae bacterium]